MHRINYFISRFACRWDVKYVRLHDESKENKECANNNVEDKFTNSVKGVFRGDVEVVINVVIIKSIKWWNFRVQWRLWALKVERSGGEGEDRGAGSEFAVNLEGNLTSHVTSWTFVAALHGGQRSPVDVCRRVQQPVKQVEQKLRHEREAAA